MISKHLIKLYQWLYSWLVLLYPRDFYQRFSSELEFIFKELLEEKLNQKTNLFSFVVWVYLETFINIFKENLTFHLMNSTIFIRVAAITASILLIPLIAMQFNQGVNWSVFDFVFMGSLLFLAGISIEFFIARKPNLYYRLAAILTVLTTIFLIISNGAVGIIGNEDQTFNLWYFGIVCLTIIGSLISNFKPKSMAYTLFLASATQGLITVVALMLGLDQIPGSSVTQILAVNGFFMVLFITAGILFYKSESTLNSSTLAREKLA